VDVELTVSNGLDHFLDISNFFESLAVLVVPIDVLVLEIVYFVEQNRQLIRDIRNIILLLIALYG
jgi:uncharacterized membrane protein